jgi:nitroimidazol reductase NimA-like FMN-containing flavoprotein (pyridoxamine 5'-phosphate oxidase superfamily)
VTHTPDDLDAQARDILVANRFMVLSTADADGRPWVSPVWFASEDGFVFLWISKPDARHSRNIAVRSEIAIVVFDSSVYPGDAKALYVDAVAQRLDGAERDAAIAAYSREAVAQGLRAFTSADVEEGARWRMYRATATARSVLGAGDERLPLAR